MGLETGEWRRCRSLSFTPPASLRSHGSRPRPTRHKDILSTLFASSHIWRAQFFKALLQNDHPSLFSCPLIHRCLSWPFFILRLHYFNHSIKSVNTFIIPGGWEPSILLSLCWVIALWQGMMVSAEPFICSVAFIRRGHHALLSLLTPLARPAWCPSYNFVLRSFCLCAAPLSALSVLFYTVFSFK